MHPDQKVDGNRIIRHYDKLGQFVDLSVDQTIAKGWNEWLGWKCSAGVRHLYIDYDGDVFNGNCKVKYLGSIYSDFTMPTEWVTCTNKFCACGADVMVPKVPELKRKNLLRNLNHSPFDAQVIRRRDTIANPVAVETALTAKKQILWDLSRRCNYACSYCWPGVHNKTDPHKDFELLKKTCDKILSTWGQREVIGFFFGGGEPTLHPQFMDLAKYLFEKHQEVVVTTNGSRLPDYYAELAKYSAINMSVHFESVNEDKFLQNVEAVIAQKKTMLWTHGFEVKIMVPPGVLKRAISFRDKLLKIDGVDKHLTWSMAPIRDLGNYQRVKEYDQKEFDDFFAEIGTDRDGNLLQIAGRPSSVPLRAQAWAQAKRFRKYAGHLYGKTKKHVFLFFGVPLK
jgi:MoaA/NifB/PqqE/SkfB family radical SAM enzyme